MAVELSPAVGVSTTGLPMGSDIAVQAVGTECLAMIMAVGPPPVKRRAPPRGAHLRTGGPGRFRMAVWTRSDRRSPN